MSEREKHQHMLEAGYTTLCQLSQKGDMDSILFTNGKAVIALKDGRRYHFDPKDKVARMYSLPDTGTYEAKETDFVRGCVQPGQVCLDIGASFGWYTVLLSKLVGPTGHVHAFEPIPHTFDILQSNIALNQCSNVSLQRIALDATKGRRDLFVPDIGVSGSFHLHRYERSYEVVNCATTTIDDYCLVHKMPRVDFIKADIEGGEWLMLKGAIRTLRDSKPVLLLEIQRHSTELFGYKPLELLVWLASLDYVPHFVVEAGSLVGVDDYGEPLPDHNFVFLPRNQV